jgi:hypothetical protein
LENLPDTLRGDKMSRLAWTVWTLGAMLCALIAIGSYRYLVSTAVLPAFVVEHFFFPLIESNTFRHPALGVHVAAAATALLLGPIQFLHAVRRHRPRLHRWIGRTYVTGCLIGSIAGIVLAAGASTGLVSSAGFGLLAVFWFVSTAMAWRHATQKRFGLHREWMIRSFALTLSAVTLRLYLGVAEIQSVIQFEDAYRAISFLCWVPNAAIAEFYIRSKRRPKRRELLAAVEA